MTGMTSQSRSSFSSCPTSSAHGGADADKRGGLMTAIPLPDGYPLDQIMAELRTIDGLVAVILGGSWAAGRQRPDSDVDLGLFYRAVRPLDVDGVKRVAEKLNDTPGPVVTPLGGWGTWVNG